MTQSSTSGTRSWPDIIEQSQALGQLLAGRNLRVSTAESCTGGLVAAAITEIAGSSAWFKQSVVTYSNEAKQILLAVDPAILSTHGAVSEACVRAMALGCLHKMGSDIAISISGIAGPGGATEGKPVGTVWIGWAMKSPSDGQLHGNDTVISNAVEADAMRFQFDGERSAVRLQAVFEALRGSISRIEHAGLSES